MIKIVIPSHKRADSVLTEVEDAILCVDEKEEALYKEHHPKTEIVTHKGLKNLAQIRQWIFEKFGDAFMVDDDIVSIERTYCTADPILSSKEVKVLISETYEIAKECGCYLFGFADTPNPKHFKPFKPFSAKGYINACAIGIRKGGKLFFSGQTTAAESHWINLLNAYHNRKCFIDKRFHFRQKQGSTFTLPGEQTDKRTLETEKTDTLFLKKMFGESVILKKGKKDSKQMHQFQRSLNIRL